MNKYRNNIDGLKLVKKGLDQIIPITQEDLDNGMLNDFQISFYQNTIKELTERIIDLSNLKNEQTKPRNNIR